MDSTSNITQTEIYSTHEFTPPRKIDYKEELIFYFFNNMLDVIVESWDGLAEVEIVDSIPSGQNVCDSVDFICSAEVDEEIVETEYEYRDESLFRSLEEIDNFSKRRYSEKKVRKINGGKKNRKSIRKATNAGVSEILIDKTKVIENVEDTSWMIEPIEENVIIKFKNGNVYEGPVFGKLMHGFGKFTWNDGSTYTGTFTNGDLTGEGTLTLKDQSVYTGEVLRGYRHGQGNLMIKGSYSAYQGSWHIGKKHGRGWQNFFIQNDWYDGQWENNAMSGMGTRQYPSGARYHGNFSEGKRNGRGVAIMKNNDYYSGDWSNGKRKGYGKYIWNTFYNKLLCVPIQASYVGSWEHNNRDGLGLLNLGMEGGARYAGFFRNNLKHGAGVLICENGATFESNHLFSNDKPVHINANGSYFALSELTENTSTDFSGDVIHYQSSLSVLERQNSRFKIITKQILFPNINLDETVQATVNLCTIVFPKFQEKYSSMCVPINTPCEDIVLNHYLKKVVEFNASLGRTRNRFSIFSEFTEKIKNYDCHSSPDKSYPRSSPRDDSFSPVNKKQIQLEEKKLRNAITSHLPRLRAIYKQYTTVGCLKQVPFPTLLTRLFLWQLYRDCRLLERGLSLRRIDDLMGENPDIELEMLHDPFETIYFWQFLHSIIAISTHLYGKECSAHAQDEGILKMAFVKFLQEDLYPNYGHHIGCLLFDYKDVLSIKNAYEKWFIKIKDPCTVRKFLLLSCTIKKCDPPSYYLKTNPFVNIILKLGVNAYILGHNMTYLQDEVPNIRTEPVEEPLTMSDTEPFGSLYFLRKLGAKTVLSIVVKLCPAVVVGKDIVNMNYEMTFYEFYESVLLCTQELVNREKEPKIEQKLEENKSSLTVLNNSSTNGKGRRRSKQGVKKNYS